MPLLISIILGGTWIPANDQIPNPMIGIKIKNVIRNPVMIGVVKIWTRWSRGPPVGMVEFPLSESELVPDGDEAEEEEEGEGRLGKGRS